MLPHQERVVEEKRELDEKIKKLDAFFDTETYRSLDHDEKLRLITQIQYMESYSSILRARILNFKG